MNVLKFIFIDVEEPNLKPATVKGVRYAHLYESGWIGGDRNFPSIILNLSHKMRLFQIRSQKYYTVI